MPVANLVSDCVTDVSEHRKPLESCSLRRRLSARRPISGWAVSQRVAQERVTVVRSHADRGCAGLPLRIHSRSRGPSAKEAVTVAMRDEWSTTRPSGYGGREHRLHISQSWSRGRVLELRELQLMIAPLRAAPTVVSAMSAAARGQPRPLGDRRRSARVATAVGARGLQGTSCRSRSDHSRRLRWALPGTPSERRRHPRVLRRSPRRVRLRRQRAVK